MMRVGITGGIGSGKSTVCRLLTERGVPVYDSDSRARALMNDDACLRKRLTDEFGPETYKSDGTLDRAYLAAAVFGDDERLKRLNDIVHPHVREDFRRWCAEQAAEEYVVLESAILFDAGFESEVDTTVAVLAPAPLRVERVCVRNGCTPEEVESRMSKQMTDDELARRAARTIVNIRLDYLRSDVEQLDKMLRYESRRKDL